MIVYAVARKYGPKGEDLHPRLPLCVECETYAVQPRYLGDQVVGYKQSGKKKIARVEPIWKSGVCCDYCRDVPCMRVDDWYKVVPIGGRYDASRRVALYTEEPGS